MQTVFLTRGFVEGHLNYTQENTALTGRRVNLSQKITSELSDKMFVKDFLKEIFLNRHWMEYLANQYDVEKGIYFGNKFLGVYSTKKHVDYLAAIFLYIKMT